MPACSLCQQDQPLGAPLIVGGSRGAMCQICGLLTESLTLPGSEAVLIGPEGPQGPMGPAGPTGPAGSAGASGQTFPPATDLPMGAHRLTDLADAIAGTDALNVEYADGRYRRLLYPSGADDTAAINAAITANQPLGAGTFKVSGIVSGTLLGSGPKTILQAQNAAAGVEMGPALPGAPLNTGDNPTIGGFIFDANNVATGGSKHCAVHTNIVQALCLPIQVVNPPTGVEAFSVCGQNSLFLDLNLGVPQQASAIFSLFFDNGAGGNTILTLHTNGHAIDFRETVGTHGYGVPEHNVIKRWVADLVGVTTAVYCLRQSAGAWNKIEDIEVISPAPALVKIEPNGAGLANGRLILAGKCAWQGTGVGNGQYWIWADFSNNGASAASGAGGDFLLDVGGHHTVAAVDGEVKWGSTEPMVGTRPNIWRFGSNVGTRPLWTPSGTGALTGPSGDWVIGGFIGLGGFPVLSGDALQVQSPLDMGSHKIQNVASPQADNDAVSRGYGRTFWKTGWAPVAGANENYSRLGRKLNTGLVLTSGRLCLSGGFVVMQGQVVSNITFYGANNQMAGGTHYWYALYSLAGALLAVTADVTTAAPLTKGTGLTLALTTPWTAPGDSNVYAAICVVATTMPDLLGADAPAGSTIYADGQAVCGFYNTGLTTPSGAPNPVGSFAAIVIHPYSYLT